MKVVLSKDMHEPSMHPKGQLELFNAHKTHCSATQDASIPINNQHCRAQVAPLALNDFILGGRADASEV